MELILFIIFGATLFTRIGSDKGASRQYEAKVKNVDLWKVKVTNETLEKELFFAIKDNSEEYSDELESAYKEIEGMYISAIKPVYEEYVDHAAMRGEDKREYWAKEMLIDGNNPLFNVRLKTDVNKLRILLAKRGYLRKEDASNGSHMGLQYTNPVEGTVLKWCADVLKKHGVTEQFGTKDSFGTGYGKKYIPPKVRQFRLYYSWPDNGWDLFS